MADAKFEKVRRTDAVLPGPRKMLLSGFGLGARPKFRTVLEMAGLAGVPRVWIGPGRTGETLLDLMALPGGTGREEPSDLPRAVVVGGITEKELHRLMAVCRKAGMARSLWAVLTPTSEGWTFSALLAELTAEREAMKRKGG